MSGNILDENPLASPGPAEGDLMTKGRKRKEKKEKEGKEEKE